jgi:hypothetical protein
MKWSILIMYPIYMTVCHVRCVIWQGIFSGKECQWNLYVKAEHVTQFTICFSQLTALCVSMHIHSMVWYGHNKICYVVYVYINTQHGKVTDTYSENWIIWTIMWHKNLLEHIMFWSEHFKKKVLLGEPGRCFTLDGYALCW